MAYEYRHSINGFYGQLTADLAAASTTIVNSAFATLPTITGTAEFIPITISDETLRLIEVVWVTAHATGSSTVTVVRGREGTTARLWLTGTRFAQADLSRDGMPVYNSGSIPSDLSVGARFVLADTGAVQMKSSTAGFVASSGVAKPADIGPSRTGLTAPGASVITLRAASVVTTTNASGDGAISFTVPFPNSCMVVIPVSADYAVFTASIIPSGESATGFFFRAVNDNGVVFASSNVRVNYIAIGW